MDFKEPISNKGLRKWTVAVVVEFVVATAAAVIVQRSERNLALTVGVVIFVLLLFTLMWLFIWIVTIRKERRMEGQAYVLFEVKPRHSRTVAESLSKEQGVLYSAALWGHWDVIARVQTADVAALVSFLAKIQNDFEQVVRTETYYIRQDQRLENLRPPAMPKWAFLLLQVEARYLREVLQKISDLSSDEEKIAQVRQAAGILGPYDIAVTVQYFSDRQLKGLVMDRIQAWDGVKQSLTIPSIEEMVFINGKVVG